MSLTIPPTIQQGTKDAEYTAELIELSVGVCQICGFDVDEYESDTAHYLMCCNCESVEIIPPPPAES